MAAPIPPKKSLIDIFFDEDPTKDFVKDEPFYPTNAALPSLGNLPDIPKGPRARPAVSGFRARLEAAAYPSNPQYNRRAPPRPALNLNGTVWNGAPGIWHTPAPIVRPTTPLAEASRQTQQVHKFKPEADRPMTEIEEVFFDSPHSGFAVKKLPAVIKQEEPEQQQNNEQVENFVEREQPKLQEVSVPDVPPSPVLEAQEVTVASSVIEKMDALNLSADSSTTEIDKTDSTTNEFSSTADFINNDAENHPDDDKKSTTTDNDIGLVTPPVSTSSTPVKSTMSSKFALTDEQKALLGFAIVKPKAEWKAPPPPEPKPAPLKYEDNKYTGPPPDAFKPVEDAGPSVALSGIKIETTHTAENTLKKESVSLMGESFHLKKRKKTVICTCIDCPLVNDSSYAQCPCATAGEPCDRWCHEPEVRAREEKFTTIKCARNPGTAHRVKKWEAGGRF